MDNDTSAVVAASRALLGDPERWKEPKGYPDSLALCIIDSIWSVGVRYEGVANVVAAYRKECGSKADSDGAIALGEFIAQVGGPTAFADRLGNHQRTYARSNAPLKAQVIDLAATLMSEHQVDTTADFRTAATVIDGPLETAWRNLPSQSSGVTWRYLCILAGLPEIKPDRMIRRFVAIAVQEPNVTTFRAHQAVKNAASEIGVSMRALDHRIWTFQSGRPDL